MHFYTSYDKKKKNQKYKNFEILDNVLRMSL